MDQVMDEVSQILICIGLKKKNSFISQWDLSFQQIRGAPNMYTICHLTTVMPWPTVPNSPRLKAHGRFWDTLFEFSQCNWFNVFYVWPLPLTTSRNWPFHSCFGFAPEVPLLSDSPCEGHFQNGPNKQTVFG